MQDDLHGELTRPVGDLEIGASEHLLHVAERVGHLAGAQPEQAPNLAVVGPVGAALARAQGADVALVDDEARVGEGGQDPEQQLGVVGRVRGAGRKAPGRGGEDAVDRRCIARTRWVSWSASARGPKVTAWITRAVRARRW